MAKISNCRFGVRKKSEKYYQSHFIILFTCVLSKMMVFSTKYTKRWNISWQGQIMVYSTTWICLRCWREKEKQWYCWHFVHVLLFKPKCLHKCHNVRFCSLLVKLNLDRSNRFICWCVSTILTSSLENYYLDCRPDIENRIYEF